MANTIITVQRKTLDLGEVKLEVFMLERGEYRLSQTQVAQAIGLDESYTRKFLASKSPYALPHKDYTPGKGVVEKDHAGRGGTRVALIELAPATAFWLDQALKGNELAGLTLQALAMDSLTRMCDRLFEVVRPEDEYVAKVAQIRQGGKLSRNRLTAAVSDYISRNGIRGEAAKFMMASVTNEIYRSLFGRTAKQLAADRNVKEARDGLDWGELNELKLVENSAANLIEQCNAHPHKAIAAVLKRRKVWQIGL